MYRSRLALYKHAFAINGQLIEGIVARECSHEEQILLPRDGRISKIFELIQNEDEEFSAFLVRCRKEVENKNLKEKEVAESLKELADDRWGDAPE